MSFSEELEAWSRDDGPKTVGALGDVFAEKSFATTVLFLMFVPALPLPTGGISHVFEAITVVVAAQMVLGRKTIWLPDRWRHRELGPTATERGIPFMVKRIQWFEKFSRPRLPFLFTQGWSVRVLGLVLTGLALAAGLAPPFSGLDTLPAMGAVGVSLSIILEDVVVLAIGLAIGTFGVILNLTIGAAVFEGMSRLV